MFFKFDVNKKKVKKIVYVNFIVYMKCAVICINLMHIGSLWRFALLTLTYEFKTIENTEI